MLHYIIMTVMDNKSIMYSGITYDIDPNYTIGTDRWSYALYIASSDKNIPVDYDNIWKNTPSGKSSISYYTLKDSGDKVCEIETLDDIMLLRLYLNELLEEDYSIEYTYMIKRVEDKTTKLYCGTIRESVKNKKEFIDYMCLVMT